MTAKEISVSELVLNLLKVARKGGVPINDERNADDIYYGVEQGESTEKTTKPEDSNGQG